MIESSAESRQRRLPISNARRRALARPRRARRGEAGTEAAPGKGETTVVGSEPPFGGSARRHDGLEISVMRAHRAHRGGHRFNPCRIHQAVHLEKAESHACGKPSKITGTYRIGGTRRRVSAREAPPVSRPKSLISPGQFRHVHIGMIPGVSLLTGIFTGNF